MLRSPRWSLSKNPSTATVDPSGRVKVTLRLALPRSASVSLGALKWTSYLGCEGMGLGWRLGWLESSNLYCVQ